jgi:hypothetical protein
MIAGVARALPHTLTSGLRAQGVPLSVATQVGHLPPVSTLFSALLGFNPVQNLLAPYGVLGKLPAHNVAVLTGRQFFPALISAPFHQGLVIVFTAAAIMSVLGALVSLLRGKQFYYDDAAAAAAPKTITPNGPSLTSANGHSAPVAGSANGHSAPVAGSANGHSAPVAGSANGDSAPMAGSAPVAGAADHTGQRAGG